MKAAPSPARYSFDQRWSPALKEDGHVQISAYFLNHYHALHPYPLTYGEAMFVIHLMQFKWGPDAPFPSYATLAQRMGTSIKTARRFAASLEQKTYLAREARTGTTNLFHLSPLMHALVALKNSPTKTKRRPA